MTAVEWFGWALVVVALAGTALIVATIYGKGH